MKPDMAALAAEFRAWINSTETDEQVQNCADFINESGVTMEAQATVAAAWCAGRTAATALSAETVAKLAEEVTRRALQYMGCEGHHRHDACLHDVSRCDLTQVLAEVIRDTLEVTGE